MRAETLSLCRREWGLPFALSIVWGGLFFFIGRAVKALPALTIVTQLVLLSTVILGFSTPGEQLEVKLFIDHERS
jgi:hypothetical protein